MESPSARPSPGAIVREWGRIGCIGFGGPPALPGPASTQLAIFCAWRVGGRSGALFGGLGFIVPGLVMILGLSALFLAGSPPVRVRGAGAGAGAAVAAVAVHAGVARSSVVLVLLAAGVLGTVLALLGVGVPGG